MQYNNEAIEEMIQEDIALQEKASRTMEYRRRQRVKAIKRKKSLKNSISKDVNLFKFDGMYNKGHVKCNCPVCKPSKYIKRKSEKTISEKKFAESEIKEFYKNPSSFEGVSFESLDIPEKYRDEYEEMVLKTA